MKTAGSILLIAALGLLARQMAIVGLPSPPAAQKPPDPIQTAQKPTEVQALFEALKQAKNTDQATLIRLEADGRLTLPESDYALQLAWQRGAAKPDAALVELLGNLYSSAAGTALQSQLLQWNRGRRVIAVRDNHGKTVTHANWRAHDCTDGAILSSEAPVPERFGYIHQGQLQTGFGAWHAVGGDQACIEFRGHFRATSPTEVRVWYLGMPLDSFSPVSLVNLKAYDPPRPFATPQCAGFSAIPTGQAGEATIPKTAWRRSTTGVWELEARLQLTPATNPDLQNPGVRIAFDGKNCQPIWQPESPAEMAEGRSGGSDSVIVATINAADGPTLIDTQGYPTAEARQLGLIPLIGFGPGDYSSLSGLLQRSRSIKHLTLTVDTRIQAITREVLLRNLPKDAYQDERRAVLVVLDATDGAILAAAAYPEPPPVEQVTPWDFRAFSRAYPLRDPLQVQAWEGGGDRHQLAGSTFKPVVVLAALTAAKQGNTDIAEMLRGWSSKVFQEKTGLALSSQGIDPYQGAPSRPAGQPPRLIHNFRGETLAQLQQKPLRDPQCAPASKPETLGLVPALRDSINSWFIALALRLDNDAINAFDMDRRPLGQRPVPDLWLIKTLRQMGFGVSQPLFANPPEGLHPNRRPSMTADQLDLLGERPTPLRLVMAQAAIGQGVSVTPLRMAALAASLSQSKIIQPRLDAAWDGQPVTPATPALLDVDLTDVRAGMKAVPEVGTVNAAFKATPLTIRCQTYAKTGTAEIGQTDGSGIEKNYNTAWLIGWHEPKNSEVRPLAFACMVTHSVKLGGAVCGPIVAELLKRTSLPSR